MNRVFGKVPSPVWPSVAIPIGRECGWCKETFAECDSGILMDLITGATLLVGVENIAYHRECFLRSVFGSVGHQNGTCSCHGGSDEDPAGMTTRQAAKAACELWESKHGDDTHPGS